MTISIITPSYGQLDWLRLCVESVADQVGTPCESLNVKSAVTDAKQWPGQQKVGSSESNHLCTFEPSNLPTNRLAIEHIIQDGGTPGIEEFARELGAEFYRDGKLVFGSRPSTLDPRLYRLAIYSESDAGMYDAINKGIAKMSGDLWAWINSDEQYLPGTLDYVAQWFEGHRDADILCGDALLTDDSGKALSYRRIVRPLWHHTRLVHLSSLSCASFYRRSIVDRVGDSTRVGAPSEMRSGWPG
jgi:glycosyltransferase involved in cell wall biosynthesis